MANNPTIFNTTGTVSPFPASPQLPDTLARDLVPAEVWLQIYSYVIPQQVIWVVDGSYHEADVRFFRSQEINEEGDSVLKKVWPRDPEPDEKEYVYRFTQQETKYWLQTDQEESVIRYYRQALVQIPEAWDAMKKYKRRWQRPDLRNAEWTTGIWFNGEKDILAFDSDQGIQAFLTRPSIERDIYGRLASPQEQQRIFDAARVRHADIKKLAVQTCYIDYIENPEALRGLKKSIRLLATFPDLEELYIDWPREPDDITDAQLDLEDKNKHITIFKDWIDEESKKYGQQAPSTQISLRHRRFFGNLANGYQELGLGLEPGKGLSEYSERMDWDEPSADDCIFLTLKRQVARERRLREIQESDCEDLRRRYILQGEQLGQWETRCHNQENISEEWKRKCYEENAFAKQWSDKYNEVEIDAIKVIEKYKVQMEACEAKCKLMKPESDKNKAENQRLTMENWELTADVDLLNRTIDKLLNEEIADLKNQIGELELQLKNCSGKKGTPTVVSPKQRQGRTGS